MKAPFLLGRSVGAIRTGVILRLSPAVINPHIAAIIPGQVGTRSQNAADRRSQFAFVVLRGVWTLDSGTISPDQRTFLFLVALAEATGF